MKLEEKPYKLRPIQMSEAEIQRDVLQYLKYDGQVAWAHRFNVGAHAWSSVGEDGKIKRHFVRYAFPGCSDIIGQMKDGRFLAVEIKSAKGRLTEDQKQFLAVVRQNGGVALTVRSVSDTIQGLENEAGSGS